MSRRLVGAKGLSTLRDELSGRSLAIVGQIAALRLMSGQQVAAVHFPSADHETAAAAERACRRSLELLTNDGLLVRLERRIGGARAGSRSFIYGLGPVGHRLLALDGPRPRYREPSATFALHTLAVSQLVVDLTLAARAKRLELLVCQPEPKCWRQFSSIAGLIVLRPDLFTALGIGDYEHRFFIEVDLGTEHLPALIRKCLVYESYYSTGQEQSAHGVFPRVCWLMPNDDRAERLRRAITSNRKLTDALFIVSTTEQALSVLTEAAP